MPQELIEIKAKSAQSTKPALLFVHGSFCSAPIWRPRFMPYFAELGYDCYAVSLRGHGKSSSDWPLHYFGLRDYVSDICAAHKKITKPTVLIGHSLGGLVVQKFMETHDCTGAILLNSLPPSGAMCSALHMMTNSPELYWALSQTMVFGPDFMSFDTLKKIMVTPDTHPASLAEVHGLFQVESLRAVMEASFFDVPRKPSKGNFPVCVMGGDQDKMIPVSALHETAAFHQADLEIIPGAPHAVMLDRKWKNVAERMDQWMTKAI